MAANTADFFLHSESWGVIEVVGIAKNVRLANYALT
jgi:hypothetical protein